MANKNRSICLLPEMELVLTEPQYKILREALDHWGPCPVAHRGPTSVLALAKKKLIKMQTRANRRYFTVTQKGLKAVSLIQEGDKIWDQ